jgi:RNase P subunit RPR2
MKGWDEMFATRKNEQNNTVEVTIPCSKCGTEHVFEITSKQFHMINDGKELIQNILPDVTPPEREMFITGVCPECWKGIFLRSDRRGGDLK